MAKRRATKSTTKKSTKRAPAKKPATKKASKSTAKKRAPAKPAKLTSTKKTSTAPKKRSSSRSRRPPPSAYERRDANAKAKGYDSYWDERTSRVRARNALGDIGHPNPNATDPSTLKDIDELGTLGRGESARELYYKTKAIMVKYEPAPTDRQIWALIRIFYKPKSRR